MVIGIIGKSHVVRFDTAADQLDRRLVDRFQLPQPDGFSLSLCAFITCKGKISPINVMNKVATTLKYSQNFDGGFIVNPFHIYYNTIDTGADILRDEKILIVDDDPAIRRLIWKSLQSTGILIYQTDSVEKRLRSILVSALIFLLDISLEHENDGYHLAQLIREETPRCRSSFER